MTNIVTLRPRYPMLWVHREFISTDGRPHEWGWIQDLMMDAEGEGIIMEISAKKPSLRELRNDYDCPVFIDED
jgi:hypothetical protein